MYMTPRLLLLFTVLAVLAPLASAQAPTEPTSREPGIYELANLFKQADTVALVKIVAGDTEAYDVAIYKAQVITSFKGGPAGEPIYFGPYLGERLGWEYLLFLRNVPQTIAPKAHRTLATGPSTIRKYLTKGTPRWRFPTNASLMERTSPSNATTA